MAFTAVTSASTLRGLPISGGSSTGSRSGMRSSHTSPTYTTAAAAMTCPRSFRYGEMLRASSQVPKASSTRVPKRNAETVGSASGRVMAMGTTAPSTMPQPPTRATGAPCTLRGLGWSKSPSTGARRSIRGITTMLRASASTGTRMWLMGSVPPDSFHGVLRPQLGT